MSALSTEKDYEGIKSVMSPSRTLRPCSLLSFGGEKTNKHKQLRGIVPEMGGGQIVYVFPLFLRKKGNT